MEQDILESEEHFDNNSLQGAKRAKEYIETLLKSSDKGLLEHEIIIAVNSKLLLKKQYEYCLNQRMTTFKGIEKIYCDPKDIYCKMQIIIDRFNQKSFYGNNVFKALVEFVFEFLHIHPFADGNGRTIKFLVWYVMKSFNKMRHFFSLDYNTWCDIIHKKSYDSMLKWFENMQ